MTIPEIQQKLEERNSLLETDRAKADAIEEEILTAIKQNFTDYPCDFIIETLTHFGWAPQLLYDDDGRFAVCSSGFTPVPTDGPVEGVFQIVAYKYQWAPSIRAALYIYLMKREEDGE